MMRVGLLAATITLAGCSVAADTAAADSQVAIFHQRLSTGQCAALSADTTPAFKTKDHGGDFAKLCAAIGRKLGSIHGSQRQTWNVMAATGGTFVNLVYTTTFDRGEATETFSYKMSEGVRPMLNGYNIASMALMVN